MLKGRLAVFAGISLVVAVLLGLSRYLSEGDLPEVSSVLTVAISTMIFLSYSAIVLDLGFGRLAAVDEINTIKLAVTMGLMVVIAISGYQVVQKFVSEGSTVSDRSTGCAKVAELMCRPFLD